MRLFSNWIRNWLGPMDKAFWALLSLARTLFLRANTFPKTVLFQIFALVTKFSIVVWRLGPDSQAFLTMLGNSGWWIHIVWNLNGLLAVAGGGRRETSKRTGQWSENTLGRWVTEASGKRSLQVGFAKHLSMRSRIRSVTCLPIVQVYFGPEKPRSKKLQSSKYDLNSKALFRLIYLPPILSFPHKISLKSPNISQGGVCNRATWDKFSHKIFLLAKRGLA